MIFYYLIVFLSAVPGHPWFGEQVGGVSIIKYVGIVALAYALFSLARRSTVPPFLSTWPARMFLLLAAWAQLNYIFVSGNPGLAGSPFMLYLSFLTLFVT